VPKQQERVPEHDTAGGGRDVASYKLRDTSNLVALGFSLLLVVILYKIQININAESAPASSILNAPGRLFCCSTNKATNDRLEGPSLLVDSG
jgi:hypothetical protein